MKELRSFHDTMAEAIVIAMIYNVSLLSICRRNPIVTKLKYRALIKAGRTAEEGLSYSAAELQVGGAHPTLEVHMEYMTPEVLGGIGLLTGLLALVYSIKADWQLEEIKDGIKRILRGDPC